MTEESEPLRADPKRDASASIRGYVYQVYQTIRAWIDLKENEYLFLEKAEDFDVRSGRSATATQVKDLQGSGNITLRSDNAVEAINNFWLHRSNNSEVYVTVRFLTTANPGREQGAPFEGIAGIEYWDLAARSEVAIEPLRIFLSQLPLLAGLLEFIASSSDEQLRSQLLGRISWETGERSIDSLIASITDSLIILGQLNGVSPTYAERALDALLAAILAMISQAGERRLTKADFFRKFESATQQLMPAGEATYLRALAARDQALQKDNVSTFSSGQPLVREAIHRSQTVARLRTLTGRESAVFIYGSTGLGKTSLATLVAETIGVPALWADFRGVPPREIADRLKSARTELEELDGQKIIILDDLDLAGASIFERALMSFLVLTRSKGFRVIVTGPRAAAPSLLDKLWLSPEANFSATYLSVADIQEMMSMSDSAPQNAGQWAAVLHTSTSGHPQLVHAKLRRFSSDGWPQLNADSITTIIGPAISQGELRDRLIQDISSEQVRSLLYRLSIALVPFPRELALQIAELTNLTFPGEAVDLLTGPWIEKIGRNVFRVSPLLGGVGMTALRSQDITTTHRCIADYPFSGKEIHPRDAISALWHALKAGADDILIKLALAALNIDRNDPQILLEMSKYGSWFLVMGLEQDDELGASDARTELMLRIFQFKLCAAADYAKEAVKIVSRMLEADSRLGDEVGDAVIRVTMFTIVLLNYEIPTPSNITMPLLFRMIEISSKHPDLKSLIERSHHVDGVESPHSTFNMFLSLEIARHRGLASLHMFLDCIERLDGDRTRIVRDSFATLEKDAIKQLTIGSWFKETKEKESDPATAIAAFRRTRDISNSLEIPSLSMFSVIGEAIVLSEYLGLHERALFLLCQESYGSNYPGEIDVAIGKILFDIDDVVALSFYIRGLADESIEIVECILGHRDAAVLAFRLGDLGTAKNHFLMGMRVAEEKSVLLRLAVGLKADAAYATWAIGDRRLAMSFLGEAIIALRNVILDDNLKSRALYATIGHQLAWFWSICQSGLPSPHLASPVPGMCSNQDPHRGFAELEIRPWSFICELFNQAVTILGFGNLKIEELNVESRPLLLEQSGRTANFLALGHGQDLAAGVKRLISLQEAMVLMDPVRAGTIDVLSAAKIPALPVGHWGVTERDGYFVLPIIALSLIAIVFNQDIRELLDGWEADIRSAEAWNPKIEKTLDILRGVRTDNDNTLEERAALAVAVIFRGSVLPKTLIAHHYYLMQAMSGPMMRNLAENALEVLVVGSWKDIAINQRFALLVPKISCPQILDSCSRNDLTGIEKVRHILDTASVAVGVRIPKKSNQG